jgi:hypothetical protein
MEHVTWKVGFKSKWIGRMVMDKLAGGETTELWKRFLFFQGTPASSIGGRFFEQCAHSIIPTTVGPKGWPLIRMVSNNATDPQFRLPNNASRVRKVTLHKVKRKVVPWSSRLDYERFDNNVYHRPEGPNNPLFDSFLVTINGSLADLWIFQMSISPVHGGSARGYPLVRKIIRTLKEQLRSQRRPTKVAKLVRRQTASQVVVRRSRRTKWRITRVAVSQGMER